MALPFEQKPDESAKAFAAFNEYLNMGPQRSLEAVGRKLGKSKALMERWSKRHNWVARVEAHAQHWAALTRRAEVQVVHEFALEKAKRQEAQKEVEWQLRCETIALARECINRFKENVKKCGTLEGIARLIELASKIGRLSCDMATDKTEKTVEEVRTLSVEFKAAIEKIYGEPVPSQFVEVQSEMKPAEVKP
jgi:hypothetical protein